MQVTMGKIYLGSLLGCNCGRDGLVLERVHKWLTRPQITDMDVCFDKSSLPR